MIEIIPITKTLVDWNTFIKTMDAVLGKPITRILDDKKTPIQGNAEFFTILESLGIKNNQHCSYGFLIVGGKDSIFRLMLYRDTPISLSVIESSQPEYYVGILSGTVEQIKRLIISLTEGNETKDLRYLANELQRFFESTERLYSVFKGYYKRDMADGTLRLEHKV